MSVLRLMREAVGDGLMAGGHPHAVPVDRPGSGLSGDLYRCGPDMVGLLTDVEAGPTGAALLDIRS